MRTQRDKGWADLDATLRRNADGTLSPAVSSLGVTLSGGGSGPMATITTEDGKKLAVTAPFALPAPTLDGASATYPNVLPDVDLQVTALPTGGWRDVIVVRTAQAAADPRLKNLHFPISADGLNVATDEAGNISLKDASGKTRLHAPTPLQWDSTPPAPPTPLVAGAGAKAAAKSASPLAAPNAAPQPSYEASTVHGPGAGAHESRIAVTADGHGFDLTPDPAVFGQGTGPWYIDPSISADSGTAHSAQVQEYHAGTTYYDAVSSLGTGFCGFSDCTGRGRERAYFSINVNSAIWNQPSGAPSAPTVYNSTLYANADGASAPGTSTPLGLYWTGPIGPGVTWNSQPCNGGGTFGGCGKVGNSFWITGTGPISFDVTSPMQQLAASKSGTWTVGIAPDDENYQNYRHHIGNNPHVTTNYDLQPSMWWPRTIPQPGFAGTGQYNDCQTPAPGGGPAPYAWYNPGWIGANQNIQLAANDWSPSGLPLHGHFHLWDDNDPNFGIAQDTPTTGGYNTETIPVGSLNDGHQYGWTANSSDGGLTSPDTPWCYFRVDKTPPTVNVTSTDFPPSGTPNPTPAKYATDNATFTLHGTDPTPGPGLNASGVACFKASTSSTPVAGWHCGDPGTLTPDANGNANYTYTPGLWGTNTLYVQAQDNAGNYSQPALYNYYAPWKPGTLPVFGDLTGDGKPDILLPDTNGNLRLINTTSEPGNANPIAGAAAASPTGTWTGVQTTHRGSLLAGKPLDDLIVHPAGDKYLYLYANDGHGNFNTRTSFYKSGGAVNSAVTCQDINGTTIPCPADFGTDWSNATQILALGTPEGENVSTTTGTSVLTRTSLLAVINHQLWLFPPGTSSARLLKPTDTQVSTASWDNYDLIGPGPANGGKQPTLWARDRTNGTIHAYPITMKADGVTPDYSALTDPTTGTIAGTGGVDPVTYPVVGSNGDLNGDGTPDLWAQNNNNQIIVWPGTADATGKVNGFSAPSTLGTLNTPQASYPLAGNANDSTGLHNGTLKGDVTFTSTSLGGSTAPSGSTNAAVLNATSAFDAGNRATWGELDSGVQVNTQQSFTVTAWAREDQSTDGVVVGQDGASTSNFMIWPGTFQSGVTTWTFGMSTSDSGWSYDHTNPVNAAATMNSNARVQLGVWTKLTASYDATTGQMALYVNGALAATGMHTTTMAPTGKLVIGRYFNAGQPNNPFKG
ncbi:LamG domain-containing protein, partial [Kitasatospora sp. SUK 42]|uniref:LamG domain-containing protein n=1 Tax=Kitasatospora sp. SUK 42 TaxID=1588882 RepID=UPI001C31A88D